MIGILHGAGAIPGEWTAPFNDTLATGVAGYHRVRIRDMGEETARLIAQG